MTSICVVSFFPGWVVAALRLATFARFSKLRPLDLPSDLPCIVVFVSQVAYVGSWLVSLTVFKRALPFYVTPCIPFAFLFRRWLPAASRLTSFRLWMSNRGGSNGSAAAAGNSGGGGSYQRIQNPTASGTSIGGGSVALSCMAAFTAPALPKSEVAFEGGSNQ